MYVLAITVFVLLYCIFLLMTVVRDMALLVKSPTIEHYLQAKQPVTPTYEPIPEQYVPIDEMTEEEVNGLAQQLNR